MSVISQERQIETMSLVLTPKVVTKFGRNFFRGPSLDNLAARAEDAYSLAVQKDFGATARSKSVAAFNEKWNTAVNRYSHNYEQIMHLYLHGLGSSFPLAYVKALSDTLHEIQRLSFAVGDLIDLYQKHISKSLRIAAVYDVLEEQYGPPKMEEVKAALRNSNFGISLIFLCLSRELVGPLWILMEANEQVRNNLLQIDELVTIPPGTPSIFGSLKFRNESDLFEDEN